MYSLLRFRNSSVFTEIFLKRIKGKRRGKDRFRLVTWLLFMGRSSVSARTSLRESMATSKTSLSPHSIRNALCMVMQPNPTIRWSRLTGTSRQQTDSMAVSMLRQHPHAHQSHPHDPKVELEPEIDPSPRGGSRTQQACPSQAQTRNQPY